MKINRQTKITGDLVVLVPYREIHVPKYTIEIGLNTSG